LIHLLNTNIGYGKNVSKNVIETQVAEDYHDEKSRKLLTVRVMCELGRHASRCVFDDVMLRTC